MPGTINQPKVGWFCRGLKRIKFKL